MLDLSRVYRLKCRSNENGLKTGSSEAGFAKCSPALSVVVLARLCAERVAGVLCASQSFALDSRALGTVEGERTVWQL